MRTKRAIKLVVSILTIAFAVALSLYALQDNIELYQTPSQWLAHPSQKIFRLGGQVKALHVNGKIIQFEITDGKQSLPVTYTGLLPSLFQENKGAVLTGKVTQGIFYAKTVLAKHDENYKPRQMA